MRFPFLLLAIVGAQIPGISVHAASLPDTGQSSCYSASAVDATGVDADAGGFPRQDCRYGADAANTAGVNYKTGGGSAGFDYTALDGSGAATTPSSGSTPHPCVRDNFTGLVWEVKTNDSGLRDKDWKYTWYDSTGTTTNGGNAGTATVATTNCYLTGAGCDTEKYIAAVNSAALCGFTNWRLPSRRELATLVNYGTSDPTIDATYFPNTLSAYYWSATTRVDYLTDAWLVNFRTGIVGSAPKASFYTVRLVSGGPL
jgi:hypothetical protein